MFVSLRSQCPSARLWVLCLTAECHNAITRLGWPDIIPIQLEDFERGDRELQQAKMNRSPVEYYFTCSPVLPLYVLTHNPEVDLITYVDSDLYFFSSPEPIFEEMGNHSIAITPHRYAPELRSLESFGFYNVGWLSFKRDEEGMACLAWWRDRCIEWCHDYVEENRYADQKYLNQFPQRFRNLKVIEHKGANLAAWNLRNYRLHDKNGQLCVDNQNVLFYHFQGLKRAAPGVVDPNVRPYRLRVSWFMERNLYRPYLKKLREAQRLAAPFAETPGLLTALGREPVLPDGYVRQLRHAGRTLAAYYRVLARQFLLQIV